MRHGLLWISLLISCSACDKGVNSPSDSGTSPTSEMDMTGTSLPVDMSGTGLPTDMKPLGKRLFVTRETYDANFGPNPNGTYKCQTAADAAGIGGVWKAWLATPSSGAAPTFKDVGPWYSMNGTTKIFNNPANLGGFPLSPIILDQFGVPVPSDSTVWTGLTVGNQSASTCYTWNCFDGCRSTNTGYKGT